MSTEAAKGPKAQQVGWRVFIRDFKWIFSSAVAIAVIGVAVGAVVNSVRAKGIPWRTPPRPTKCAAPQKKGDATARVRARVLARLRKEKKKVVVLDVRSREEYGKGHVAGALWMSYATSLKAARTGKLPFAVSAKIVLYGGRPDLKDAKRVVGVLKALGCKDVSVLEGGFESWKGAGLRVEK